MHLNSSDPSSNLFLYYFRSPDRSVFLHHRSIFNLILIIIYMMLSESSGSSFCFMTSSNNSAVFVSDKDLNKGNNNMDPSDQFDLLVIPSSSMEVHKNEEERPTQKPASSVQERDKLVEQGNNNVDVIVHVAPLRKLKLEIISSLSKGDSSSSSSELEQDGLKTPTSSDHKIAVLECPGAPRKPLSRPAAKKRKGNYYFEKQIKVVPDPYQDLESLFFPTQQHLIVDLGAAAKIKRVKQYSPTS